MVTWFVAVPDVTDARAYATLNGFRSDLSGVGIDLVSLAAELQVAHELRAFLERLRYRATTEETRAWA